ncbi:MAG TPA: hypothetical protein VGK09_08395 [Rhodocyclaceae bacterium]|jgi:hypothetical protein
MSGTFPSTPKAAKASIKSTQPTRVSTAHSFRRVTRSVGIQRWQISLSWQGKTRAQLASIIAFCLAQRGQYGSFQLALPSAVIAPLGTLSGIPVVNGGGIVGNAVATRGWTANAVGVLKAGDYISFYGHTKVYMVTADASSDGAGNATLTIEPPLLASPADGAAVQTSPSFTVALASDDVQPQYEPGDMVSLSLDFVETW